MLSFNCMGTLGRFANQMFQYASLKGIAYNRGFDFCIPPSRGFNEWSDHMLFRAFDLLDSVEVGIVWAPEHTFKERMFCFDEEMFNTVDDNTDFSGFFQTQKYFKHIEDIIRSDFTFKNPVEKPAERYIAVHVRRGDYLTNSFRHPPLTLEWYRESMDYLWMSKDDVFAIFSDDINWCKNQDLFTKEYNSVFVEGNNNIDDMHIMSLAEHNIIANS